MAKFKLQSSATDQLEPVDQKIEAFFSEIDHAPSQPHLGLKQIRKEVRLTQEEMAVKTGVSRKTYQLYEAGKLPIPSDKIGKLALEFGFDIHKFFNGKPFSHPLQLKVECAQVGIAAFKELLNRFDDTEMTIEEMERIAIAYAKHYEEGEGYKYADLLKCVELVTGFKYLQSPNEPHLWDNGGKKHH